MSVTDDVRDAVMAIPPGFVASYGDIGRTIGAGPRQVGRAMSQLDDSVPWWRVVYADGTPASCHGGRAPELLSDEETPMLGSRVDMKRARHRWAR
jgi:alkylated DNA nucleotide flippase Atl1